MTMIIWQSYLQTCNELWIFNKNSTNNLLKKKMEAPQKVACLAIAKIKTNWKGSQKYKAVGWKPGWTYQNNYLKGTYQRSFT